MKNKQAILLVIATMLLTSLTIFAAQTYTVKVNGNTINGKVIIENGTTYVPLRAISEALGCKVDVKNGVIDIGSSVATLSEDAKVVEPTVPTTPTKTETTPTTKTDNATNKGGVNVSDENMIKFASECADYIIKKNNLQKSSYEVSKTNDVVYALKITHRAVDTTQMMMTTYILTIEDVDAFNKFYYNRSYKNCGYSVLEGNSIGL